MKSESDLLNKSREFPLRKYMAMALRAARVKRGLSQTDLAELTGLKPSAISHFETGNRSPTCANLERLANALRVKIDDLFGR